MRVVTISIINILFFTAFQASFLSLDDWHWRPRLATTWNWIR